MNILRFIAVILPQALALLIVAGRLDLLAGWNKTDSAFGVLIVLFLVTPVVTAAYMIVELVVRRRKRSTGLQQESFFWPAIAIMLFVEALALDLFILSQVRMH